MARLTVSYSEEGWIAKGAGAYREFSLSDGRTGSIKVQLKDGLWSANGRIDATEELNVVGFRASEKASTQAKARSAASKALRDWQAKQNGNGKRNGVHSKARRLREHLYLFASIYTPLCYVCGEVLDAETLCCGDASDGVTWHHIDMKRDNDDPSNLAPCHRSCHREFHRAYEERKEDIRSSAAIEHWGKTPKVRSCRSRKGGAIRRK